MTESLEHKIERLRTVRVFAELPPTCLESVARAAEILRFAAGREIVRQGDPGDAVYALTEGEAEVWLQDGSARPVLLRTMGPGQLFGETAVLYNGARSATITAKTDVATLRVPGPVFLEFLRSIPEIGLRIAESLAQRLASDRHTLASEPLESRGT